MPQPCRLGNREEMQLEGLGCILWEWEKEEAEARNSD